MRIAVVGNCQVYGVRHAVRAILPACAVDAYPLATLPKREQREEVAKRLLDYDFVFSQPLDSEKLSPLCTSELIQNVKNLTLYPAVSFTGFHPDQILLYQTGGISLLNAFGASHSLIIASSFAIGLPKSRVADLFNTYIFERLGFFSEYSKSKDFLVRSGMNLGFRLDRYFDDWQRSGSFMHTTNHPAIRVLATIARDTVVAAGLCPATQSVPNFSYDALSTVGRWPVYPQIARRCSVDGGFHFTKGKTQDGCETEYMTLDEFIFDCYQRYEALPKSIFGQGAISFGKKILAAEIDF